MKNSAAHVTVILCAAAALAAALVSPARAEAARPNGAAQGRQAPAAGSGPQMKDLNPADIQRLFDAYMVMHAQEALRLKDEQYGPFVEKLKRLQVTRRQHEMARRRALMELSRLAGATETSEAEIRGRLEALREIEGKAAAALRDSYSDIDQVLDVRQQARFRVFEEQMERRKLDLLLRARRPPARGTR
jgi:hypothetical protein